MRNKIIQTCFLFCLALSARAQNWKEQYPEAEAIYTTLKCDIVIRNEKGKLSASSRYTEDLVYLTDNSVKMMGRGHIYHSSFNELKKWEAYVKTEKKKVAIANTSTAASRQEYIFYDDAKATSFDYAGAVVGSTRHMEWEIEHKDAHLLSPHYFDRYFPVVDGEINVTVPQSVKLKYIIKGLNKDKVSVTETKKGNRTIYSFSMKNHESVRSYADAPDNAYYATHVIYYIDQYEDESGAWKNFLSNEADLYAHSFNFIRKTNQSISQEIRHITDSITKGITEPREKANRIYKWVQKNIKYVAFEDGLEGFIPREASLVCSRRFGDCKDMTSILHAMLNHAGIPAYFTWIGTRDIPYKYTEVPLPLVDNHMICTIKLGEEYVFLDGTDDGCIFGIPPYSIQGKQAMVSISEKEFKILDVPVMPKTQNVILDSTFLSIGEKEINGTVKLILKGYFAADFQSYMNYKNEKEREEYLKNRLGRGNNKISFSNWKLDMNPDHTEAVVTASFTLPDYARRAGTEIYLNMNLFRFFEHQEIDYPKRKVPIENSYKNATTFTTVLQIPEGYKVSYLPKGEKFQNSIWGFDMQYSANSKQVIMSQHFEEDYLMIQPEQFSDWNKVLEHLFPHYKQTIALSKN